MTTNKRKGGRPQNEVWEHYTQGERDSEGHASETFQHPFADKLLKKVNILATFFRNNARAGAKFRELLNTMNIKGGVIVLYCKTRWTTAYKSIDDVLRVKAVLENKFSDSELNNIINETLAERPELEEDDDETMLEENQGVQRTTDGHIIPNHKVMVWIENTLDLFNPRILSGLENFGEFPEEEEDEINGNVNGNNQDDNEVVGRGILNFNVDDLAEEFEN
ncbi:20188_t:CDS:2 [Rhizophagus irregularis]|nr:20188_t:CDS:2 [Rhizophagus irregularis]